MRTILLPNMFSEKNFQTLKAYVDNIANQLVDSPLTDTQFNRHHLHNEPFLAAVHPTLTDYMSEVAGQKVKPSYCFLSIYRQGGICPLHTDRPQCKYTLDLCISQSKPWPLFVDGAPYYLRENDALIYSGTDSPHYRDRLEDGNHCTLAFFHFVPEDFVGSLD